ncbi:receptor-like protein kinase [Trifolium pratense]|uniref:Receptor-like protein kinase n=1 Tax=Trifolium pratense TaxID=57577 RepID=A0A2K3MC71_TRIPR|nr:receptor-like protein kinase [Trifolium pratense]
MDAIIADFGTALYRKLSEDSYSHSETRKMLSTIVVGTPGYIAPGKIEYIADSYLAEAFPNSAELTKQVTTRFLLALQCTEKDLRKRLTVKYVTGLYKKDLFKLRCGEVGRA